ncbi:hypothetical protein EDB89DRAFT_2230180 [Lactarius sanguifluus]|nr:hypothetical protein EDB89DRAFT_2230180 [Lactarius sanguifluus]
MPATSNGFHYDDVSALRDPDPNIPDVATYEPNSNPDHHHTTTGAFRRRKMGCTWRHEDGNNHHYHDRGASYRVYQHAEMKDRILHTAGYALPATPRNHTSRAAAALAKSAPREVINALSSRITLSTPSYLRQLYNMMEYVPVATLQNTLAVAGYFGDYPRQEDLTTFMEKYRSDGLTATFSLMQVDGEALPNGPSEEASSNIQYTATLTYPTPQTFYSASYGGESFLVWVNYVLTQRDIPQTISTSYDGNEQDLNEAYATVVCRLFAMLGARNHDRNQVVMTTTWRGDDHNARERRRLVPKLKKYDIVITSYEVSNEVTTLEEFNWHY